MAINRNIVQAAVISALSTDAALTTYLSNNDATGEIKEVSYFGVDFVYPAVRVSVGSRTPIGDGSARHKNSNYAVQIYVYDERPSSKHVSELAGLVESAINEKTLPVTSGVSGIFDVDNVSSPSIGNDGVWQVLITGTVRVAG